MVDIPEDLRAVFTGTVERRGDSYVVEVPADEIARETITPGTVYRTALLGTPEVEPEPNQESEYEPTPPVTEGERRTVTVEAVGSEGDGIAKVERGYVVIVPDTEVGEETTVEIERVTPSVAFAKVAENGDSGSGTHNEEPPTQ